MNTPPEKQDFLRSSRKDKENVTNRQRSDSLKDKYKENLTHSEKNWHTLIKLKYTLFSSLPSPFTLPLSSPGRHIPQPGTDGVDGSPPPPVRWCLWGWGATQWDSVWGRIGGPGKTLPIAQVTRLVIPFVLLLLLLLSLPNAKVKSVCWWWCNSN